MRMKTDQSKAESKLSDAEIKDIGRELMNMNNKKNSIDQ